MYVEIPSLITIHTKYNFRTALLWVIMQQVVVISYHYLLHNKPRSAWFSATSRWKPVITYIHFNSLAWQFYKLSYIFMQKYVIGAVLPVRSVTIQDLEHIDGSCRKVATKTRCQILYIWYSTVIVSGLV